MRIIDHRSEATEPWREGVRTRMIVSAAAGSSQLCQFEQWCAPGTGAPTHHHAVEEVLSILAGTAQVWVGDEQRRLVVGQSVLVPAGHRHGFSNVGDVELHVRATLAAPVFEAAYDDGSETPRRWLPASG